MGCREGGDGTCNAARCQAKLASRTARAGFETWGVSEDLPVFDGDDDVEVVLSGLRYPDLRAGFPGVLRLGGGD